MESIQLALMIIAMVATLVVLVVGVISFAMQGDAYIKHANTLMRARVAIQGIALALIALVAFIAWLNHHSIGLTGPPRR